MAIYCNPSFQYYAAFVPTKYMYIYMKKCTDTNFKNDNKQLKWWELFFLSQKIIEQSAESEAFIVNFNYYSWQHFPGIKLLESLNVFLA